MKYLRTKTTIYEVEDENEKVYLVKAKKDENNLYSKSKINTYVVAVSNKLEDIIDEYVCNERGVCCIIGDVEAREIGGMYDIKGAIWTDKGLIYVAKMNSEGELELL